MMNLSFMIAHTHLHILSAILNLSNRGAGNSLPDNTED